MNVIQCQIWLSDLRWGYSFLCWGEERTARRTPGLPAVPPPSGLKFFPPPERTDWLTECWRAAAPPLPPLPTPSLVSSVLPGSVSSHCLVRARSSGGQRSPPLTPSLWWWWCWCSWRYLLSVVSVSSLDDHLIDQAGRGLAGPAVASSPASSEQRPLVGPLSHPGKLASAGGTSRSSQPCRLKHSN